MTKEELSVFKGIVLELLPNASFRVQIYRGDKAPDPKDPKFIIIAYISGSMRQNRIKIVVNDEVMVEMSGYDLTKGRIVKRLKKQDPNAQTTDSQN